LISAWWAVPQAPLGDLTTLFRSRRFSGGLLLRRGKRREGRNEEKRGALHDAGENSPMLREYGCYRDRPIIRLGPRQASRQLNPALMCNTSNALYALVLSKQTSFK